MTEDEMKTEKKQIIELESRFWQSLKDQDVATAQSMIAEDCFLTGPKGTVHIGPREYGELARQRRMKLDEYALSDADVIFPTDDVAIIAYKVHETGELDGRPMDMICADSTTWVRDGDGWKGAIHTETIMEQRQPQQT